MKYRLHGRPTGNAIMAIWGPFNNYVTLRGGGGLSDALRSIVKVTLKSVTKGGGRDKNRPKKRYGIVERPLTTTGLHKNNKNNVTVHWNSNRPT